MTSKVGSKLFPKRISKPKTFTHFVNLSPAAVVPSGVRPKRGIGKSRRDAIPDEAKELQSAHFIIAGLEAYSEGRFDISPFRSLVVHRIQSFNSAVDNPVTVLRAILNTDGGVRM